MTAINLASFTSYSEIKCALSQGIIKPQEDLKYVKRKGKKENK